MVNMARHLVIKLYLEDSTLLQVPTQCPMALKRKLEKASGGSYRNFHEVLWLRHDNLYLYYWHSFALKDLAFGFILSINKEPN